MRKICVGEEVFISTPHNAAASDDIVKTILMPGDPLRAKFIAETYSENPVQFNTAHNMSEYTSTYKGKKISAMGSDMGTASVGIYSYEPYKLYEVENIIRIGSAGAYTNTLKLFDLVLASSAWSESIFAKAQANVDGDIQAPGAELDAEIEAVAARVNKLLTKTRVHSSDVFYHEGNVDGHQEFFEKHGCIYVEVENFTLFHDTKISNKRTACLLTISDSLITYAETTAQGRQTSFHDMILVALEAAVALQHTTREHVINKTREEVNMKPYKRILTIIIGSLSVGAISNAAEHDDEGRDMLGHINVSMPKFHIPNLAKLGLANLHPLRHVAPAAEPLGYYTKLLEASVGRDTMAGR